MIDEARTGFEYTLEFYGLDGVLKWKETIHNLLPDEGRDYIMGAAMNGVSQHTSWYVGLFSEQRTPVVADTMESFLEDAAEVTSYEEGARVAIVSDTLSGGLYINSSSPAEFTFSGSFTARGAFITTNSLLNNTTGLLLSAGLFPTVKTGDTDGGTLKVKIGWAMNTI